MATTAKKFVICVKNKGYEASLEPLKKAVSVQVLRHFQERNPHTIGTAIAALESTLAG